MFQIKAYKLGSVQDKELTRVICVAKYKDKYVFAYNKERCGWEIPGGHIETGESYLEAAKREMYEETGATKINIIPVSLYKISTYGIICYCEILELSKLPNYEMSEVMFSTKLPDKMTYPDSSKLYFKIVDDYLNKMKEIK